MTDTGEKIIPVKVAVRCRPLLPWEINDNCKECVNFIEEAQQVVVNGSRAFTYDYIFDSCTQQETVYEKAVSPLISGIFKGYNGTVLAYGQTGSGKTYSMGSAHCISDISVSDDTTGVIPRVIKDIFSGIKERQTHEFLVKVSYVEIYKEEVKDLLARNSQEHSLAIRENIDGSIQIRGLSEAIVSNVVDTLEYMEQGNANRSTGSTAMNSTSSRSHAIFTITLESRCIETPDEITRSKFHLVDLAGSERVKRTKAEGDRMQEGIKINAGLLALGNVISALGEGQHGQHIPYRVSKLTRLLQDSLGGNSLTVMIACISPADSSSEETINTLRYADRARKIKNKAIVNRDPRAAELASLRKEIQQLRMKLVENGNSPNHIEVIKDSPESRERLRKLEDDNRQLLQEMQKLVDTNADMCEKALMNDVLREKLEKYLLELQTTARNVSDDPHDLSLIEEATQESKQKDCMHKLRQLRDKVLDMQVIDKPTSTEEVLNDLTTTMQNEEAEDVENISSSTITDETREEDASKSEHILRTAKLSNQLQEITAALAKKEELAKRMSANDKTMSELRKEYEERLRKLDKDITHLQDERDGLAAALEAAKKNDENQKISEKRRLRLNELETQIRELKKEKREKEKITNLKAQSDQKIVTLHNEIQAMKASKVKLMKQIKEENAKFLSWKKDKNREVLQLKQTNRKRQYELVKLERDFTKQKNVLRRKTEEAAASNRRLKEALLKQRNAAEKRQQSNSKSLDSANTRMKIWMEEDLEIVVSSKMAKKHLEELENDLKSLRNKLNKMDDKESPSKRRRTYVKSEEDESQSQKRELHNLFELKEAQAKELRSKLADADARTRQQTRLLQITSIAEARSTMKHMFNLIVDSRLTEETLRTEARDLHNELRRVKVESHDLQERVDQTLRNQDIDRTALENAHQEQIIFLTKQLNQSQLEMEQKDSFERERDLTKKIKIQANLIEQLEKEKEEMIEKGNNGRLSLFQPIIPDVTATLAPKKAKSKKISSKKNVQVEYLNDDSITEEADEEEVVSDYDSDYVPTPLRRKQLRQSTWKSKVIKQDNCCNCQKTRCNSKLCRCRKADAICSALCGCNKQTCLNREIKSNTSSTNTSLSNSGVEQEMEFPYYNRVPGLFTDDNKDKSPLILEKSYKPIYFDSPLREVDSNLEKTKQKDPSFQFAKPKTTPIRKRRLHPSSDINFS